MFLLWLLVGLVTLNWEEDINGFWLQSTVAVTEYEWHYNQKHIQTTNNNCSVTLQEDWKRYDIYCFWKKSFVLPKLHLFDQNYSKNGNVVI